MIKKLDHVVITVNCIEKCLDFYEKLGFIASRTNSKYELYAGDFKINVHERGNELFPHAQNVQSGSADFCFEISGSLNELKAEFISKAVDIEEGIVERFGVNGRMKSLYVRDPDGNLLEFCCYEKNDGVENKKYE